MKNNSLVQNSTAALHSSPVHRILQKITSNSIFQWNYKEPFKALVVKEVRKSMGLHKKP